jgi:hypothetical protein
VHPPDLRPLLHADHALLLARSFRSSERPDPAGRTRPHARWVTFRPAQVGHYSRGAHSSAYATPTSPAIDAALARDVRHAWVVAATWKMPRRIGPSRARAAVLC